MSNSDFSSPPILNNKHYSEPSVFQPENLLREARRQKTIHHGEITRVCILDPDGDFVDHLKNKDKIKKTNTGLVTSPSILSNVVLLKKTNTGLVTILIYTHLRLMEKQWESFPVQ